ncbi:MAG: outer membrane beta-barrel protein [Enterovibrio sp.]
MKKHLALSIILALSTSAFAAERVNLADKSGHTLSIGFSKLTGDLADISDDYAFSFGYDYTTSNGVIFGGFYTPELLSVAGTIIGLPESRLELDASVLGLYSGYQFDNNVRLTAGLSFTRAEENITLGNVLGNISSTADETKTGFMLGIDYLWQHILIGSRVTTHDVAGLDGTTISINAGYKF